MDITEIKKAIALKVYQKADELDWGHLTIPERQRQYENWTSDPDIGGKLAEIMPVNRVRVYLKDTVLRQYSKKHKVSIVQLIDSLNIKYDAITRIYEKPEGVLCDGLNLYTTTAAKDWKSALASAFERAYLMGHKRENLLIITDHIVGRFVDQEYRELIEDAASRLEISVVWLN